MIKYSTSWKIITLVFLKRERLTEFEFLACCQKQRVVGKLQLQKREKNPNVSMLLRNKFKKKKGKKLQCMLV